jgi:hypothetical protein
VQLASGKGLIVRAVATLSLTALLGATPTIPAPAVSATDVMARVTRGDAAIDSYAVPVRIDVRVHKWITLRMHFNGTQYYKRPDRLALDMHAVPAQYRQLFAQLGTPLTWSSIYDLRLIASNAQPGTYQLEGIPKHPGDVERLLVDVDGDAAGPLHAQWFCRGGGTIDMHINETMDPGGFALPQHAEADMSFGGYNVHATLTFGPYAVNEAIADAVFGAN